MNLRKSKSGLLLVALVLGGCSSISLDVAQIYYKNGVQANIASCSGGSWLACYQSAGDKCQQAGYTVLEKLHDKSYGFIWTSDIKQLIFSCNASKSQESR